MTELASTIDEIRNTAFHWSSTVTWIRYWTKSERPVVCWWVRPVMAPDADWLTSQRGHRAIGVVYDPDPDPDPDRRKLRAEPACRVMRRAVLDHQDIGLRPLHLEAARRGELERLPTGV